MPPLAQIPAQTYRARMLLRLLPLLLLLACQKPSPPVQPPPQAAKIVLPTVDLPWAPTQTEPPAQETLGQTVARLRERLTPEGMAEIAPLLTPESVKRLKNPNGTLAILPVTLQAQLAGPFDRVQVDGGRAALISHQKGVTRTAWLYLRQGHWLLDAANMVSWQPPQPGQPHPLNHPVSLAQALTGVTGEGPLYAELETTQGKVHCLLLEREVPELVANFVGLARGIRGWRDADGQWVQRPFYENLKFHRGQPQVWAVTGDPSTKGPGNAGFHQRDVLSLQVRHDKPGTLSLVGLGPPNTGSSQIALFARPAPWADDQHQPFGLCEELDVIEALSQQPLLSQTLLHVRIQRGRQPVPPVQ